MRNRLLVILFLIGCVSNAQDSDSGFAVSATLSGGLLHTHRLQGEDRSANPVSAGFRAMAYPTVKLGRHWFGYGALGIRSKPYFLYDAYNPHYELVPHIIQAFAGYTTTIGGATVVVKAGKLASAFGSFPLRYDDADNPLLGQPLSYVTRVKLRPDQLACGVEDLLHQAEYYYSQVTHYCGGPENASEGMSPVPLYGIHGAQADLAWGGADLRFQLTNSSPVNQKRIFSPNQHLQWTAGGGYTIRRQLRVGVSAFRGPYLERNLKELLPTGTRLRDFAATAVGFDVQWSGGRWSTHAEWQWFQFASPRFLTQPSVTAGYAEAKAILTPRFYVAGRFNAQRYGSVRDRKGAYASSFSAPVEAYEFGVGYHLNRHQRLKVGYEWLRTDGRRGTRDNVFGIQLVTSIYPLSRPF